MHVPLARETQVPPPPCVCSARECARSNRSNPCMDTYYAISLALLCTITETFTAPRRYPVYRFVHTTAISYREKARRRSCRAHVLQ